MKDYCRRYRKCEITELSFQQQLPYVYLFSDVYGFTVKEAQMFFACSRATAYRLLKNARFWHEKSRRQRDEEKRIADYILYSAQWRGGNSIL